MPKEESKYELAEVPTNTEIVIKTPEGEMWTMQKAIVELLNKTDLILTAIK